MSSTSGRKRGIKSGDQYHYTFMPRSTRHGPYTAHRSHIYWSENAAKQSKLAESSHLFGFIFHLKPDFHYPSSRPKFTGRDDAPSTRVHFLTPVNSARELWP